MIINPYDVFAIGNHRFSCADIELIRIKDLLNMPDKIYLVYSDPPWNPGNARMWRTLSGLDGISGNPVDWDYFIRQLYIQIMAVNPEHVFIESGCKQTSDVLKQLQRYNFIKHQKTWQVYYNSVHRNMISYFSNHPCFLGDPTNMKNESMTKYIFDNIALCNNIVFDPCIGKGMTARMAYNFNMIIYGNEINPSRLSVTLNWLSKQTGLPIERI